MPKFYIKHGQDGAYLHRFTLGYFTDGGDDPSCWGTTDKATGHKYTQKQIDKMRPYLLTFQGEYTVEAV